MSVTLTLMRHGIAEPFAPSDTERALTPRGREQVSAVAAWLTRAGWRPGVVIHSPLLRARQTAEEVMAHLPPETEAVVLEEVVLAGAPLLTVLAPFAHLNPLVVGHNPTISQLASRLLDASGHLPFDKATAACFRLNRLPPTAPGELVFFAPAALSACE